MISSEWSRGLTRSSFSQLRKAVARISPTGTRQRGQRNFREQATWSTSRDFIWGSERAIQRER